MAARGVTFNVETESSVGNNYIPMYPLCVCVCVRCRKRRELPRSNVVRNKTDFTRVRENGQLTITHTHGERRRSYDFVLGGWIVC